MSTNNPEHVRFNIEVDTKTTQASTVEGLTQKLNDLLNDRPDMKLVSITAAVILTKETKI